MFDMMSAALAASMVLATEGGMAPAAPPAPPPIQVPRMPEESPQSRSPLVGLVSPDDYPQEAIDAFEQGELTVELFVTPEGRVGRCRIVRSSGSVSIDATTCRIMTRRARFSPARDSVGHAVEGVVEHKIRWVLESVPYKALAAISIGRTNDHGALLYCYDHSLSRWCADPTFDLSAMTVALAGTMPRSADLVRTVTFTPGDQRLPTVTGVAQAGDRILYNGSARVEISRNGKVTQCVESARTGEAHGSLCALARTWLFTIDPDDDETRNGVWSVSLSSRPPR